MRENLRMNVIAQEFSKQSVLIIQSALRLLSTKFNDTVQHLKLVAQCGNLP